VSSRVFKSHAFELHRLLFSVAQQPPIGPGPPHYRGFTITPRHTTFVRTPLDEWSARHRDLFLTTHDAQKRQTSVPPAGSEPAIPASEWLQTHALDRAASAMGELHRHLVKWIKLKLLVKSSSGLSNFKRNLFNDLGRIDKWTQFSSIQGFVSFYKNRVITYLCLSLPIRTQAGK
jgi:hypothetical protein